MKPTLTDYLNLITSEHRDKPDFMAMVQECGAEPMVQLQDQLASMIPKFDVDTAVGEQLDIIGKWVGVSRRVNIPITGIFFEWDSVDPQLGWDLGTWEPNNVPTTITELPDESYRVLVRAKIAANRWDGTTEGAYDVWEQVFPDLTILIQDNLDMSYDLIVVGDIISALTQALITGGYIPLKPEGVRVATYYFPVNDGPAFGWNVESDYIKGWGEGSWMRAVEPS